MLLCNYHSHTTFCDGTDNAESMVAAAISRGLPVIGFSGHGFTAFDRSFCMTPSGTLRYQDELRRLQKKYSGIIRILIGVEQDFFGEEPAFPYDFIIGSAHYIKAAEGYWDIDDTAAKQAQCVQSFFGGNYFQYAQAYFEMMSHVIEKTHCTFVGHFDLIKKFNKGSRFFDETDRRYIAPAVDAAVALCGQNAIFEINTGAVWKGYRSDFYPSELLLKEIKAHGGRILFSSDSHNAASLCCYFDAAAALARRCGFKTSVMIKDTGLSEIPI